MKLEALVDATFKSGMAKLATAALPLSIAYKLKGLVNEIEAELKKYEDVRQVALKQFGKLKEDGTYEVDAANQVVFKSLEDASSFAKQHAELVANEVTISKLKLDLDKLGDSVVGITAAELQKLEAVLEF